MNIPLLFSHLYGVFFVTAQNKGGCYIKHPPLKKRRYNPQATPIPFGAPGLACHRLQLRGHYTIAPEN